MNIQLIDLKNQYAKLKVEIDQAIHDVLSSGIFIQGELLKKFEDSIKSKLKVSNCISCANGTDALQISLMAAELNKGDEVIVPAFTYIASAEAIALLDLKPVFADVDYDTYNLTLNSVTDAHTEKIKCIIPSICTANRPLWKNY